MKQYKDTLIYIIFALVAVVWLFVKIKPILQDFISVKNELKIKTTEVAELERKVETLKATQLNDNVQTIASAKKIFKPFESGLEAEASFATIFDDVIEFARFNGIKVRSIEYVYNPLDDAFVKGAPDKYNVCQLNMELVADYSDFESFLKDLYKYPNLVSVAKIELQPYEKNKKILLINFQLKLYSAK